MAAVFEMELKATFERNISYSPTFLQTNVTYLKYDGFMCILMDGINLCDPETGDAETV